MPFSTIVVCGGGTMGRGIAQQAAQCGKQVILFDVNNTVLLQAEELIQTSIEKLVQKGKLSTAHATHTLQQITYTSNIEECTGNLIIEAIIENIAIKKQLFSQLAAINSTETVLCSNTSSISITQLAANIPNPERFAGLHFFNPATLMQLVEIVSHATTDLAVINQLQTFCTELQKTAVVCTDAPGFIVNRVARHYYLEAMRLKELHPAVSYETIDKSLTAHGFKMGAFSLMDLIGLDINYAVSKQVWTDLGEPKRLTPSPLQAEKVAEKKLGKKTGEGFYKYHNQ